MQEDPCNADAYYNRAILKKNSGDLLASLNDYREVLTYRKRNTTLVLRFIYNQCMHPIIETFRKHSSEDDEEKEDP